MSVLAESINDVKPNANTDLSLSMARVRKGIDFYGLNNKTQSEIIVCHQKLHALKALGGDGIDKKYISKEYEEAERMYNIWKMYKKLGLALQKNGKNIDSERLDIRNKLIALGEPINTIESLKTTEQTNKKMSEFEADNTYLKLFIQKSEKSYQKVRFNDDSFVVITMVCEKIIKECVEGAMSRALEEKKKIVKTIHIADSSAEHPFYPLYQDLEHYQALESFKQRYENHVVKEKSARSTILFEIRKKNKNKKEKEKADFSSLQSFEETEVELGFARKVEKNNKFVYQWKGLDYTEQEVPVDFKFYIDKLCKNLKCSDSEQLKISKSIKVFLSNIVLDFLLKISPYLRIMLDHGGVKTVNDNTVVTVLKMLLCNYCESNEDGSINWISAYSNLFDEIKAKLAEKPQEKPEENVLVETEIQNVINSESVVEKTPVKFTRRTRL